MNPKMKKRFYTVFFMFAVTFVFIIMVSSAYLLTRDRILINRDIAGKKAMINAAGMAVPQSPAEAEEIFNKRFRKLSISSDITVYRASGKGNKPVKYVFIEQGPGLWGEIEAVIGVAADLKTITGIEFTKQSETPGLGARIAEGWFTGQFPGKNLPLSPVAEEADAGIAEINGITGATKTTKAVLDIINNQLYKDIEMLKKYLSGEQR